MAKIDRFDGNLQAFASQAQGDERTVFGGTNQSDTLDANITADWLRGWGIVGVNENPTKQDFNGLAFTLGQLIAYLHQRGIPEWNSDQEFFDGSVTSYQGALYVCLTDGHVSATTPNADATNWKYLLKEATISASSRTEMKAYDVPAGTQFSLEEGGRSGLFVVKSGTPPSDPEEGFYVVLNNGNYSERINKYPTDVEWFGAVLDGTDNKDALLAADALADAGQSIEVNGGTLTLSSDASLSKRPVILNGVTESGNGNILNALVERTLAADGSKSFGVGQPFQFGSYYRFGRNAGGPIGLTIGGGDPRDGQDGNVLYPDTNSSWSVLQPTKYGNAAELAIQPSSINTTLNATAGSGAVTRASGEPFDSLWEGRRIYLSGGLIYKVGNVTDSDNMTLVNINDTAASLPATRSYFSQLTGIRMQGECTVSGTTVSRVSGDPFVPNTNTEYFVYLGGSRYVVDSVTDDSTLTLVSAPINGSYSYDGWTSVDDLSAAVRVQKVVGAGFEEVLTLAAYASGKFQLHAGTSGADDYPLFIGNNFETGGEERKQITLTADGLTSIGGDLGASLVIPYKESAVSQLQVEGNAFNEVYLTTRNGNGSEVMYLNPNKEIGFGTYTAGASSVTGYITVRDSGGNIRKLAVIS